MKRELSSSLLLRHINACSVLGAQRFAFRTLQLQRLEGLPIS